MCTAKRACLAALIGLLVWLGLSPAVARSVYEKLLMPRCPSPAPAKPPELLPQILSFPAKNGQLLEARFYKQEKAKKLVVYYGGRNSNLHKNSLRAESLLKAGVSVFTFEYRGFGDTKGKASSTSLLEDGVAAFDAARKLGYCAQDTVIFGESLGASVASYVSAKRRAGALVLQSGFGSLELQLKDMILFLRFYPRFLFPQLGLSTVENIKRTHPPLLIIHGEKDKTVQAKHASWLASVGGAGTSLEILPGAEHSELYLRQDWLNAVRRFLTADPAESILLN